MKSVSSKVTIWSVAALVISCAAFFWVARSVIGEIVGENFDRFNTVFFDQARTAYQTGGSSTLSKYLSGLNRSGGTRFYMTDAQGKDLATGEDRGEVVRHATNGRRPFKDSDGRLVIGSRSNDGRYCWLVAQAPPSLARLVPFYLIELVTVGAIYWLVAANIALPLRRLATIVDRFGNGDLTVRAATLSTDEVGDLGRSFNAMAERIHILLASEHQLLQDVSHELRSPLARLTFEAEMVRKTLDRDASAARLRHEIERLSELIGTLIDMTRYEGEPRTVQMEDVCLNDLLHIITRGCSVEAEARQCTLAISEPAIIQVRGSAELLRRAIENVVRNAIRYSPEGTVVEISLEHDDDVAAIIVRDYGPGIPEESLTKVFDPFFRVDPSRAEATGGAGLGLAIARRAVKIHGGDIRAVNVCPGALLHISLPVLNRVF